MNNTYDNDNSGTTNNNDCVSSCLPLASCTEACQSIQHIIVDTNNDLACLHPVNYFKLHNPNNFHDGDDDNKGHHHHNHMHHQDDCNMSSSGSPVMYAAQQSLITGLTTKCEYCGNSNVHNCQGVTEVHTHLVDYQRRMMFDTANNITNNNAANSAVNNAAAGGELMVEDDRNDNSSRSNNSSAQQQQRQQQRQFFHSLAQLDDATDDSTTTSTASINNNYNNKTCHRPKLFFLKKRPPFASKSDPGWNTSTQHRTQLFEPPSSMEGVGRGYGEVRGQLGGCDLVNYTSPKNGCGVGSHGGVGNGVGGNGGNSLKSPYQIYQRSYSLPIPGGGGVNGGPGGQCASSVCGETELSFNGGGVLAGNNGYYNINGGGGRRSPVDYNGQYGGNGGGGSDAGGSTARSLSPLSWVNGNEMKGVMKWFA